MRKRLQIKSQKSLLLYTKNISAFFFDIFFPPRCLNCGKYGEILCFDCAGKIVEIKTATCPDCGRISALGRYCNACSKRLSDRSLCGILVAARYDEGPTKEMIHRLKYSGVISQSEHLAELISSQIAARFSKFSNYIIVPVPLHKSRKNSRGFNQSELIARHISAKLDLPGGDALVRTLKTKNQVGLPRSKRLTNLIGAFSCVDTRLVKGKKIFLIDDVATTGATLNECAKVLKAAGAKEIWGAVIARNI